MHYLDLLDPARFAAAIDRVAERNPGSFASTRLGNVSLTMIREHGDEAARLLVEDFTDDRLPQAAGVPRKIEVSGKRRTIYQFEFCDQVLQTVVAGWLSDKAVKTLSPSVFSYRRGMAYHQAVHAAARFIRQHRRNRSDPHQRHLFLLRRDVKAYFDTVPVDDGDRIWDVVRQLLGRDQSGAGLRLARRAIRPLICVDGVVTRLKQGLPTGSPVANEIANVYLANMDRSLDQVAGGFYARYGDDVLTMHSDKEIAKTMDGMLMEGLEGTGLRWNQKKGRNLYLTAAGRRDPAIEPFVAAGEFDFLGYRIDGRGSVSLPPDKTRDLLKSISRRAVRAGENHVDEKGRIESIVSAVNLALDPSEPAAHPASRAIRNGVTDRGYLKWLDREIFLTVSASASGLSRVRALRKISPRVLYCDYGLRSVTTLRNATSAKRI